MKKYNVEVFWQMCATVEVEAENLEEAISKVDDENFPLPDNGEYLNDSFQIDDDLTYILNRD